MTPTPAIDTEATVKLLGRRRAHHRASARATARSTPSTRRCGARSSARYPQLDHIHLTDFKVRILDSAHGTGAVTRVLIDSTDGERAWTTIGVSREHHRGVVAGPRRLARLRPAPRRAEYDSADAMAAPSTSRSPTTSRASYESPPTTCPTRGRPTARRGSTGRQPAGAALGYQGPDQGYALHAGRALRGRARAAARASTTTTPSRGCLGVALRRASLFGRAPVIHDLTVAFTIWGFLDRRPPTELVEPGGGRCSRGSPRATTTPRRGPSSTGCRRRRCA